MTTKKWYRNTLFPLAFFFFKSAGTNKEGDTELYGYGFGTEGEWNDFSKKKGEGFMTGGWVQATPKEVRDRLFEEIKKKKFRERYFVGVPTLNIKNVWESAKSKWFYDASTDTFYTAQEGRGGMVAYSKGVWAKHKVRRAYKSNRKPCCTAAPEFTPKAKTWYIINRRIEGERSAFILYRGENRSIVGINHDGRWTNYYGFTDTFTSGYSIRLATPDQVKELLCVEGLKRGYTDLNVISIDSINSKDVIESPSNWRYEPIFERLYAAKVAGVLLFDNGVWADKKLIDTVGSVTEAPVFTTEVAEPEKTFPRRMIAINSLNVRKEVTMLAHCPSLESPWIGVHPNYDKQFREGKYASVENWANAEEIVPVKLTLKEVAERLGISVLEIVD